MRLRMMKIRQVKRKLRQTQESVTRYGSFLKAYKRADLGYDCLAKVLERFGMNGLDYYPETAADRFLTRRIRKSANRYMPKTLPHTGKRCHIVFSEKKKQDFCKKHEFALTQEEYHDLLTAPAENFSGMPLVLNTLENAFEGITVIGDSAYKDRIFHYLEENPAQSVRTCGTEALIFTDGVYHYQGKVTGDELLIIADLLPRYDVFDESGTQVISFFISSLFKNDLKATEFHVDLFHRIVPKLLDAGVHVVECGSIEVDKLPDAKIIRKTMWKWGKLRAKNALRFGAERHRNRGTEYLMQEENSLAHTLIRGYSEMYGNGTYINFYNGFRHTVGNKENAERAVFLFGPCFIRGNCSPDDKTIASELKKRLGDGINVYNFGSELHGSNLIARRQEYRPGDIFIWFSVRNFDLVKAEDPRMIRYDLTESFRKVPHPENHISDLPVHFDQVISDQIAEDVYALISENGLLAAGSVPDRKETVFFGPEEKRVPGLFFSQDPAFTKWISDIRESFGVINGSGAIVMNCNPFTCGHRYLIEYAAARVERLYVFVVREDKSFFPFEDRLKLVKDGTADLSNVVVVSSGDYMISSMTLPGYFEKDQLKDAMLDATTDLELFLQIAAELKIRVRFAGEEPLDAFTRQYNRDMKRIFGRYGLDFCEIPRMQYDGDVISASRVRRAMREKRLEEIRELVPETTYRYLETRMGEAIAS